MSNVKSNIPQKDADTEKPKETVAPLEEDDEFEDFPVEGSPHSRVSSQQTGPRQSRNHSTLSPLAERLLSRYGRRNGRMTLRKRILLFS